MISYSGETLTTTATTSNAPTLQPIAKVPQEVLEMYGAALDQIRMLKELVEEKDALIKALREEQYAFDSRWREMLGIK